MTGRERILAALDGDEPDRVPCALNFYRVDGAGLAGDHGFTRSSVDVEFVSFSPSPEEADLRKRALPFSPDTRLGTPEQVATYTQWSYAPEEPDRRNPLARAETLQDLESFPFPDVSSPYEAEGLREQVADIHATGLAAGGNLPHLGGELFEAAWRLRGLENFLEDLAVRPEWAHYLLDRLTELGMRNADAVVRAGVDILSLDDDVAMPTGMMMSPDTWRTFFKPRIGSIIKQSREQNPDLRILWHSDGDFTEIVDDLLDLGVDAINPLQVGHMDAAPIRERYGHRLTLWGTIGHQTTFSRATPDQIRQEVQERIDALGRRALVLCPAHDLGEPDIPWENVAAFLEAVREFG